MRGFALYEISGRRARPQTLPDVQSHPKGKIYEQLTATNNPGEVVTAWRSPTQFTTFEYGLRPRNFEEGFDGERFGLDTFDGSLEMLFIYRKGRWILKDIWVPKGRSTGQ
jgi:hypothetical protein